MKKVFLLILSSLLLFCSIAPVFSFAAVPSDLQRPADNTSNTVSFVFNPSNSFRRLIVIDCSSFPVNLSSCRLISNSYNISSGTGLRISYSLSFLSSASSSGYIHVNSYNATSGTFLDSVSVPVSSGSSSVFVSLTDLFPNTSVVGSSLIATTASSFDYFSFGVYGYLTSASVGLTEIVDDISWYVPGQPVYSSLPQPLGNARVAYFATYQYLYSIVLDNAIDYTVTVDPDTDVGNSEHLYYSSDWFGYLTYNTDYNCRLYLSFPGFNVTSVTVYEYYITSGDLIRSNTYSVSHGDSLTVNLSDTSYSLHCLFFSLG